jgi:hypothetical protein
MESSRFRRATRGAYTAIVALVWLLAGGCGGNDSGANAASANGDPPGDPGATTDGGLSAECADICSKTGRLGCPASSDFATCTGGCLLVLQAATAFCPAQASVYADCLAAQPTDHFECTTTGLFQPKFGVCTAELNALNSCGR